MNINVTSTITPETMAITRRGIFRPTDVMATVILGKFLGDKISLCRLYELPNEVAPNIIVYDIGDGLLNGNKLGEKERRENNIAYSTAGLVWRRYGHSLVQKYDKPYYVWDVVDEDLIQGIDSQSNISVINHGTPVTEPINLNYLINGLNIKAAFEDNEDEVFKEAVNLFEVIFDTVFNFAEYKRISF